VFQLKYCGSFFVAAADEEVLPPSHLYIRKFLYKKYDPTTFRSAVENLQSEKLLN
jgi:hypothetical protein